MSSNFPLWNKRMESSTRGRIIVLLRASNLTVHDLTQSLGVTQNAIRAHLATLERDGFVRQAGLIAGTRKPHYEFELTPEAEQLFPKSIGLVTNQILTVLQEQIPAQDVERLFVEVAHRLAEETAGNVKTLPLEERAQAVVDLVGSLGGLAEIEQHPDHLLIHGISCPFASIVCEHGDMCQVVGMLISEIAQAPVRERCDRGEKVQCYFEIEAK